MRLWDPDLPITDVGYLLHYMTTWYNEVFLTITIPIYGRNVSLWAIVGWAVVGTVILSIFKEWQYR